MKFKQMTSVGSLALVMLSGLFALGEELNSRPAAERHPGMLGGRPPDGIDVPSWPIVKASKGSRPR
ncbi:MAG TPA: hypothetical protein VIZ17_18965 [Acetobacteraceae bacterium]